VDSPLLVAVLVAIGLYALFLAGLALAGLVLYLASPIDLVPDFLPVIGVLDDAILVVLTLRWILHAAGAERVTRHWRGSARGLELVLRAAYRPGG
jgi:uncharacterized membrane protein YkvA (DUF1232 family)